MRGRTAVSWGLSAAAHVLLALLLLSAGVALLPMGRNETALSDDAVFLFESPPAEKSITQPPAVQAAVLPTRESAATAAIAVQSASDTAARMQSSAELQRDTLTTTLPMVARPLQTPSTMFAMAGIRMPSVRRVVFLLDASGSMIGCYPAAVDAVIESIGRLSDEQQFAVIPFQADDAFLPEGDALRRAGATLGQRGRDQLKAWLNDKIIPSGGSNPTRAVRAALALKPDTVVIVSAGLLGAGDTTRDRDVLLAELDALNPRDARSGRRPVLFACIHLMQQEPLGALELVAREHGMAGSYRFLPRLQDLRAAEIASPAIDDEWTRGVAAAVERAQAGDRAAARVALLRIGLAHPLHEASPAALLAAAEISLNHDHDPRAAQRLAAAAAQGARAFGLGAVQERAEAIARDPNAPTSPVQPTETNP
ncbi:MAG: hypothetical protein FJ285_01325 [Planctomycetes bacterium]|nr:hypothetical protein [Planctomycetota bacterium]